MRSLTPSARRCARHLDAPRCATRDLVAPELAPVIQRHLVRPAARSRQRRARRSAVRAPRFRPPAARCASSSPSRAMDSVWWSKWMPYMVTDGIRCWWGSSRSKSALYCRSGGSSSSGDAFVGILVASSRLLRRRPRAAAAAPLRLARVGVGAARRRGSCRASGAAVCVRARGVGRLASADGVAAIAGSGCCSGALSSAVVAAMAATAATPIANRLKSRLRMTSWSVSSYSGAT